MNIILPIEVLDYIFEFINYSNIIKKINEINQDKYDLYMFYINNNMNSYYQSAHDSHRMKLLYQDKEKIFRKSCVRLLIYNNFSQTCKKYYYKCNKGLLFYNEDKELFKLKMKNRLFNGESLDSKYSTLY
tara:strand:- start:439 stop:828 length:390 start_codon:yes stop_codon:yes gene_type:complete